MEELRPGLRRWTAFHPKWKQDVASLAVETADGLVLIDPLLGDERIPEPQHVLVSVHWHVRSAGEIAERWPSVRVWATHRKGKPLRGHAEVTDVFAPGDTLAGGIEARPTAREAEVCFWLPDHRALVFGDVILGAKHGAGGLRLCPKSWLDGRTHEELVDTLRPLLDLPVELVLVAHGEPVLEDGRAALRDVLSS
jgi:glyoxylase-like metal-dependent hydrolase (beta-lactamase superfamily II)